jgi:hypothetical protein
MTIRKKLSLCLIIGFAFIFAVPVNAQFITIARKIKSLHSSDSDVATVLLDAKPYRVYQTIIDTLSTGQKFKIVSQDKAKRCVEFSNQKFKVTMQVDSLEKQLTQITVAAAHSDNDGKQATDVAVGAIQRVCLMVGIKCTVDKK